MQGNNNSKTYFFVFLFIIFSSSSFAQLSENRIKIDIQKCCSYQNAFINGSCISSINSNKTFPTRFNSSPNLHLSLEIKIIDNSEEFKCRNGNFISTIASDISSNARFLSSGYLIIGKDLYSTSNVCLNSVNNSNLEMIVCTPLCEESHSCVPLCSEDSARTRILSKTANRKKDISTKSNDSSKFSNFFISRLNCIAQGRTYIKKLYNTLEDIPYKIGNESSDFCITAIFIKQETNSKIYSVLTCGDKWPYEEFGLSPTEIHLYGICSAISIFFMLFAITIYLLLWKRQTVHTWTQLCYILSLLGLYICIVTAIYLPADPNNLCTLAHFVNVFFYTLFSQQIITWLALLSFDLFLSFWRLKPSVGNIKPNLKRFYIFAAIGWTMPTLVLVTIILLNRQRWMEPSTGYCVEFDHPLSRLYGLTAVLGNIGFFVATFIQIMMHRKNTQFASQNASKQQSRLMGLLAKLFLITGITFSGVVVELITKSDRNRSSILLFLFRALICLQGLVVFLVYLCNKKTWNQLLQGYPKLSRLSIKSLTSFGTQSTRDASVLEMRKPTS